MPRKQKATTPTVGLDKLALAGQVIHYVTGGVFRVLDAPAQPTDRCIRMQAASPDLYAEVAIPLATAPAPDEPRALKGGVFEVRSWKALDGLSWQNVPAVLSRDAEGLHVSAAPFGSRDVTFREGAGAVTLPDLPESEDVTEQTIREFRKHAEGTLSRDELPGSMLTVFSLLSLLDPKAITTERYAGHVAFKGMGNGVSFRFVLPLVPR